MKRTLLAATALLALGVTQAQDEAETDTVTIGVSIPTATHGFMGGLNF